MKKYPVRKNVKVWITDRARALGNLINTTKQCLSTNPNSSDTDKQKLFKLENDFCTEINAARKTYINEIISKSDNICRGIWRAVASET